MNTLFGRVHLDKIGINMIYDLAVVGNGIAAQTFLWNLSEKMTSNENKSQNFSVAHIYSEKCAPACSLRSLASISLNGVEESAQGLGEDLRVAYFKFIDFYQRFSPPGIHPIKQHHFFTNEKDKAKMLRRFTILSPQNHPKINGEDREGAQVDSYILETKTFLNWFQSIIKLPKKDFSSFLKNLTIDKDGNFELHLEDQSIVKAKKVVMAIGAYSKIYGHFYRSEEILFNEEKNVVKAGSFLERNIDLGDESFLFTIDMNKVMYRAFEKKLLIGSVTTVGAFEAPPMKDLQLLLEKVQTAMSFDLGRLTDFKVVTGLRHKGPRRKFIAERLSDTKEIYGINGFYKNGFTLNFLAAEKLIQVMND
jgi:hypothetical protein